MSDLKDSGNKRVLFVTPYPKGTAGSQRFRFEHFYHYLEDAGYKCVDRSFISRKTWDILYKEGHLFGKFAGTLGGFLRRFFLLFTLYKYDAVFIHREATPLGPPFFEWFASKIFKKKIIYDFDDAIWKFDISNTNRLASFLKQPGKVPKLIKWATLISAGNDYLAGYSKSINQNIRVIPTVVDTENHHTGLKDQTTKPVHIGWTGTHTTLRHLEPIVPVIRKLEDNYDFKFFVICNTKPDWDLKSLVYIPWNKESEIEDLRKFHIGLMPLPDNEWANGKCGFKVIQYMSLGIVPVADPVGVNTDIIDHGNNGLLVGENEDWETAIVQLLEDDDKRTAMGKAARKRIESGYSAQAHQSHFLSLFEDL